MKPQGTCQIPVFLRKVLAGTGSLSKVGQTRGLNEGPARRVREAITGGSGGQSVALKVGASGLVSSSEKKQGRGVPVLGGRVTTASFSRQKMGEQAGDRAGMGGLSLATVKPEEKSEANRAGEGRRVTVLF